MPPTLSRRPSSASSPISLSSPRRWRISPRCSSARHDGGRPAESTGFDRFFFNSIVHRRHLGAAALVIGTLAAYGFSRYPLKGNDTYLFIILTTRMLPAIVVIIPVILMFRVAGLAGSYPGIILLYTAFNLPFTIWMMKSFFDELSPDVEDAARIDGSSEIRVFFKICLPQVVAGLAATFVFGLILTWNEFLFALLLTGVDTRTVPVAMNQAVAGGGTACDGRCWPPSKRCSSSRFSSSPSSCRITCCVASPSARSRSDHVDHRSTRRSPRNSARSLPSRMSTCRWRRAKWSACSGLRAAARRRPCA